MRSHCSPSFVGLLAALVATCDPAGSTAVAQVPDTTPAFKLPSESVYPYRGGVSFYEGDVYEINGPIKRLFGDGGENAPSYSEDIDELLEPIASPARKSYAYFYAGELAAQAGLKQHKSDDGLSKKWFEAAEKLTTKAILFAEVARAESEVVISAGLQNLSLRYQLSDGPEIRDRGRAFSLYRDAYLGETRLRLGRHHVDHLAARKRLRRIAVESLSFMVSLAGNDELPQIMVAPRDYREILRRYPSQARRTTVMGPVAHNTNKSTTKALELIAGDTELITTEEKATLLKAATIVKEWESRASSRVRQHAEKEVSE